MFSLLSPPDSTDRPYGEIISRPPSTENRKRSAGTSSDGGGAVGGLIVLGLLGLLVAGAVSSSAERRVEPEVPLKLSELKLPPGKPRPREIAPEVPAPAGWPPESPALWVIVVIGFILALGLVVWADVMRHEQSAAARGHPASTAGVRP